MTANETFRVEGMSCAHCVRAVEAEVGAVAGVDSVAVDLDAGLVTVSGVAIDDAAVRAAIADAGYRAV